MARLVGYGIVSLLDLKSEFLWSEEFWWKKSESCVSRAVKSSGAPLFGAFVNHSDELNHDVRSILRGNRILGRHMFCRNSALDGMLHLEEVFEKY